MARLLLSNNSPHYEIALQEAALEEEQIFVRLESYQGHRKLSQSFPITFDGQTQKCRVREQDLLDLGWTLEVDSAYVPGGNENG